jgi:hypothetical protein
LDFLVCNSKTLNGDDLVAITRRMQVWTKADVKLKSSCGQVDKGLVELVLSALLEEKWCNDTSVVLQSFGCSK